MEDRPSNLGLSVDPSCRFRKRCLSGPPSPLKII